MEAAQARLRAKVLPRALVLLMRPRRTWAVIAAEPTGARELYAGYVAPLAGVGPVCSIIGGLAFGSGIAGIQIRPSVQGLLAEALLSYLSTLLGVFLLGLVIAAVAPRFGGSGGRAQALKLAGYSGTALWLAGVCALLPALGLAASILAALYSLYLLREGLPVLMRTPEAQALSCFALILILALALGVGLASATAGLRSMVAGPLTVVGVG